jgi:phosphate starvation-inducible protein PhoH and related proteins
MSQQRDRGNPDNEPDGPVDWRALRDAAVERAAVAKRGPAAWRPAPRTDNQRALCDALRAADVVLCRGVAGTGKTMFTCLHYADLFKARAVDQILVTRVLAPVGGRNMGAMPGGLWDKAGMYVEYIQKYFARFLPGEDLSDPGRPDSPVRFVPMEALRGCTFERVAVVLDEAQNCSKVELKMLMTRLGEGARLAVLGDPTQVDVRESDFDRRYDRFAMRRHPRIATVETDEGDMFRHELLIEIERAFDDRAVAARGDRPASDPPCGS